MYTLKTIKGYVPKLTQRVTEKAIKQVKDDFQRIFAAALGLERISAPVMVRADSGLNDDLSGIERPVRFDVPAAGFDVEIVQSLAKWKRWALRAYGFGTGEGLYTDMNAIRRDDRLDNLHSVYVDQWDWEKVIADSDRTSAFLHATVQKIVHAIADAKDAVNALYPALRASIERNVTFITSEQLRRQYPRQTPKEREYEIVKAHKTVFIEQIGGEPVELSSMGIRVNAASLRAQLQAADALDREKYDYHKAVLAGALPLTVGGGIGQSRLCMLLLEKVHIGEVQASVWPSEMLQKCRDAGIPIL